MAIIPLNQVVQVRFITADPDRQQIAVIVRHWKCTSFSGTGGNGAAMLAVLAATYPSLLKAMMHNNAEYKGMFLDYIQQTPQPVSDVDVTGAGVGAINADPAPPLLAGIVTWRTQYAGRSYRGRTYFPFPPVTALDTDSRPTTTYKGLLDDFADQYEGNTVLADLGGGNSSTMYPCVYSRLLNAAQLITTYQVQSYWGEQHRRGDYGALNISPI